MLITVLLAIQFILSADIPVVPLPRHVTQLNSTVTLSSPVHFLYPSDIDPEYLGIHMLNALFDESNITFTTSSYTTSPELNNDSFSILFTISQKYPNDECYELNISSVGTVIDASSEHGLFYGIITLTQLIESAIHNGKRGSLKVPCLNISDAPEYGYRSMMLDVSRHYSPIEEIERYIDILAYHKMNRLQIHLTDDQGWRVESKLYPKLTEIGAWRAHNALDKCYFSDKKAGYVFFDDEVSHDEEPYGYFYTQDAIRALVAYAAHRHVTVVPEVDLPGHVTAALASYPSLSCTGETVPVATCFGISAPTLCTKPETLKFVAEILQEVHSLFNAPMFHIGGDECKTEVWKNCSYCKEQMVSRGFSSLHHLQSIFINTALTALNTSSTTSSSLTTPRLIVWEEAMDWAPPSQPLDSSVVAMVWKSPKLARKFIDAGRDIILSPTSHLYWDYFESPDIEFRRDLESLESNSSLDTSDLPLPPQMRQSPYRWTRSAMYRRLFSHGPSLKRTYELDLASFYYTPPSLLFRFLSFLPSSSAAGKAPVPHILGAQGNLWTEWTPTTAIRQRRVLPRLTALSEVVWTPAAQRDYVSFQRRMQQAAIPYYKRLNVSYNPVNVHSDGALKEFEERPTRPPLSTLLYSGFSLFVLVLSGLFLSDDEKSSQSKKKTSRKTKAAQRHMVHSHKSKKTKRP